MWLEMTKTSEVNTFQFATLAKAQVPLTWPNRHLKLLLSAIGAQTALAARQTQQLEAAQQRLAEMTLENTHLREFVLTERKRVIEVEQETRQCLARDLHDGVTQLISSVVMRLDFCKSLLEKDPARLAQEIGKTQQLAEQAVHEIRTLLFELRPLVLEREGLVDALQVFMERRQVEVEGAVKLALQVEPLPPQSRISRQETKVETALFAIVQEAVNNAIKYAQAAHIMVQLRETPTAIQVIITDDGLGFDVDKVIKSNYERRGSLGLLNLRERAELIGGKITINSTAGQGTQIILNVPGPCLADKFNNCQPRIYEAPKQETTH